MILFRLEEVEDRRSGAAAEGAATLAGEPTAEYDTFEGDAVQREGVSKPTTARAPVADDAAEAEYRRHGTVALQAVEPEGGAAAPAREPPERTVPLPDAPRGRRPRKRRTGTVLLLVAIVIPVLVGGWLATRAVYFVGTDPGPAHSVTIYRGLPYELPFGVHLYQTYYESGVPLTAVPQARRTRFTDHKLRSRDDAEDLVIQLERGQVE